MADKISKVSDCDAEYCSGNFTLVSSDGVEFKVASHFLLSHSVVLRSMMDAEPLATGNMCVELTDRDIENSSVIRAFLDLCTRGQVSLASNGVESDKHRCSVALGLASFVVKYDCPIVATLFAEEVRKHLRRFPSQAWQMFIVAAHLARVDICVEAINRGGFHRFGESPRDFNLEYPVGDASTLDATAWPLWAIRSTPAPYYAALLRGNYHGPEWKPEGTWKDVAAQFERAVRVLRPAQLGRLGFV